MNQWTLQRLFLEYPPNKLGLRLPLYQLKAVDAITTCRTAKMGSHGQYCEHGHLCGVYYNSCRHRGCPQCQNVKREQWLSDWSARLLNTPHHHWIFTCPHELLPLWRYNRSWFQDCLFKAVSGTLKTLSKDERQIGGQLGYLLALHTWSRNLGEHPHLHGLITHGGVDDNGQWRVPKLKGLLPAEVVKRMFRGKFLALVSGAITNCLLVYPPEKGKQYWQNRVNKLGRIKWQVYACKPYRHGFGVARYLARYIRGGALKNHQILNVKKGLVSFKYHSHQTGRKEVRHLNVTDFEALVLKHIPLPRQQTIRYYGIYHPSLIKRLNTIRSEFGQSEYKTPTLPDWQDVMALYSLTIECPICKSIQNTQMEYLKTH
ncbi:transposase [Psychromonas sp.]|uniref:IS91 family transposase n=1 Tax=Psychromonas sp. TaxID=1884585 RepID=UPI0039E554FD